MGLFSFLQGSSASDNERTGSKDPVQAARSRARRRLIGAAVLLGVGVIGFPLLFETQPRPIPVDIPIEIPRKEGAAAAAAAAAARRIGCTRGGAREQRRHHRRSRAQRGRHNACASRRGRAPEAAKPPKSEAPKPEAPKAEAAKAEPRADDGARARALLEGQAAQKKSTTVAAAEPAKTAAADGTRFVVQVGAYRRARGARRAPEASRSSA